MSSLKSFACLPAPPSPIVTSARPFLSPIPYPPTTGNPLSASERRSRIYPAVLSEWRPGTPRIFGGAPRSTLQAARLLTSLTHSRLGHALGGRAIGRVLSVYSTGAFGVYRPADKTLEDSVPMTCARHPPGDIEGHDISEAKPRILAPLGKRRVGCCHTDTVRCTLKLCGRDSRDAGGVQRHAAGWPI